MQVSLNIQDSYYNQLMAFIKSLPKNAVEVIPDDTDADLASYMKTPQFEKDKAELHETMRQIESGEVETISHNEVWQAIDKHTQGQ